MFFHCRKTDSPKKKEKSRRLLPGLRWVKKAVRPPAAQGQLIFMVAPEKRPFVHAFTRRQHAETGFVAVLVLNDFKSSAFFHAPDARGVGRTDFRHVLRVRRLASGQKGRRNGNNGRRGYHSFHRNYAREPATSVAGGIAPSLMS